ncbi:MAG: hypothetical protein RQ899_02750 [Pseudomonadales bacterium]|nr:hypothetical protein [Pseudomonadales bacterium]
MQGNLIVIKKARQKFNLADLVARMPKQSLITEETFGKPLGKEVW